MVVQEERPREEREPASQPSDPQRIAQEPMGAGMVHFQLLRHIAEA